MQKIYTRERIAPVLSSVPAEKRDFIRSLFFPQIIRTSVDRTERGNGNRAVRRAKGTVIRWGTLQCDCAASPCGHEGIYLRQQERRDAHRARRGFKTRLARRERS